LAREQDAALAAVFMCNANPKALKRLQAFSAVIPKDRGYCRSLRLDHGKLLKLTG